MENGLLIGGFVYLMFFIAAVVFLIALAIAAITLWSINSNVKRIRELLEQMQIERAVGHRDDRAEASKFIDF